MYNTKSACEVKPQAMKDTTENIDIPTIKYLFLRKKTYKKKKR